MDEYVWYKIKWVGYEETTWELVKIFKNINKKVKEYYKRVN